jgi:plastocyanin
VDGETTRRAKVGEVITLTAVSADDGIPKVRALPRTSPGFFNRFTVDSATGHRLSWFLYRGDGGNVTFSPTQTKVWEDTREGADSPWGSGWKTPPVPKDGKWEVKTTFSKPGTYVLRCLAHDGGLSSFQDVTFVVTN